MARPSRLLWAQPVVVVTAGLYASPLAYWVRTQWLNRHVLEAVRECFCILVPKVAMLSKLSSSFGVPFLTESTRSPTCDR